MPCGSWELGHMVTAVAAVLLSAIPATAQEASDEQRVPQTSVLQFWLLKTDGTVVERLGGWARGGTIPVPVLSADGSSRRLLTPERSSAWVSARFDHVEPREPAGVDGHLTVLEISAQE